MTELPTCAGQCGATPPLTVFRPGSLVVAGSVTAKVLSACLWDGGRLTYEVVWWAGTERRTAVVEAFEVSAAPESQELKIGFA